MRRRVLTSACNLVVVLVLAEAVVAMVALAAGKEWDWSVFARLTLIGLGSAVVQAGAEALMRRGPAESVPRRWTRSEKRRETARAVRSGVIPPGVDPVEWRSRIDRHVRTVTEFMAACVVGCLVAAALTAAVAARERDTVLWTMAVVTVLLPALPAPLLARNRRNAGELLAQLDGRESVPLPGHGELRPE